jgi:hypothetical protein
VDWIKMVGFCETWDFVSVKEGEGEFLISQKISASQEGTIMLYEKVLEDMPK